MRGLTQKHLVARSAWPICLPDDGTRKDVYEYNAQGKRIGEKLMRGIDVLYSQTDTYNDRGWLFAVNTNRQGEEVEVTYKYDLVGNQQSGSEHRFR